MCSRKVLKIPLMWWEWYELKQSFNNWHLLIHVVDNNPDKIAEINDGEKVCLCSIISIANDDDDAWD